jgi:hypothetical protein
MVVEILACKDVQRQGVSYLERMFKSKQVHESLIKLLKGGVQDRRFVEQSKGFGIDWISKTITSNESKQALKGLVQETFIKDQRVQKVSIDLCKYFVAHPTTKQLTGQICSAACLQPATLGALNSQLQKGGLTVA